MNWYVVYTRPRWEKKISKILEIKGIENYCPLNKVSRQWSDRKKIILTPLFTGYLFVKLDDSKKWEIKNVDGILNFVYWLGKPALVRQNEIDNIKKFLSEFDHIEVVDTNIIEHAAVEVNAGVLMNYKGIVIDVLGSKARVKIDSMGVTLCALIDKRHLSVIQSSDF